MHMQMANSQLRLMDHSTCEMAYQRVVNCIAFCYSPHNVSICPRPSLIKTNARHKTNCKFRNESQTNLTNSENYPLPLVGEFCVSDLFNDVEYS